MRVPSASFDARKIMTAQMETTPRRRRRKNAQWRRVDNARSATIGAISLLVVFALLVGFIVFSAVSRSDRFSGANSPFTSQLFDLPGTR